MPDEQTRMYGMMQATRLFDNALDHVRINKKNYGYSPSQDLAESKTMFYNVIKSKYVDFQTDLDLFDIMFLIKARHELEVEKEKERRENCECCH